MSFYVQGIPTILSVSYTPLPHSVQSFKEIPSFCSAGVR